MTEKIIKKENVEYKLTCSLFVEKKGTRNEKSTRFYFVIWTAR